MARIQAAEICCPSKRASLEQCGQQMAATATPRLDMCQGPQQTAEVNLCHSLPRKKKFCFRVCEKGPVPTPYHHVHSRRTFFVISSFMSFIITFRLPRSLEVLCCKSGHHSCENCLLLLMSGAVICYFSCFCCIMNIMRGDGEIAQTATDLSAMFLVFLIFSNSNAKEPDSHFSSKLCQNWRKLNFTDLVIIHFCSAKLIMSALPITQQLLWKYGTMTIYFAYIDLDARFPDFIL